MKIAIVGGGISGLSTAFYLKRFSPSISITLYEAEDQLGGKLKTIDKFGFSIELTTPLFSEKSVFINELIKDAGLLHHISKVPDVSKIKYFFHKASLHTIPSNKSEMFQTNSIGLFGKISAFADFARPRKKSSADETLFKLLNRRVGKSAAEIIGDLLATSFFASTPDKLSAQAAFPWIENAEKTKGKILGDIFEELSKLESLITFKNGSSAFIRELSSAFSFNKKIGTEVSKIKKADGKWAVESKDGESEFDKVVLCTPSFVSSRLIKEEDETTSELLKEIEYSPLAIVSLAYENLPHEMRGLGIINSRHSNTQALGIIWDSSIFMQSAPAGKKLLRVIIGGQRQPFLAIKQEEELLKIATGAIAESMGVYEEPMLNHITRWHKAIPSYNVGHTSLVKDIYDRVDKLKGLYLNSSALSGISIDDCVKNSKKTALKIVGE